MQDSQPRAFTPSRRRLLVGAAAIATSGVMPAAASANGTSPQYVAARSSLAGGRTIRAGRVTLDIPRLAESGNSVPLKVTVASPMTAADHVAAIHILSEQNPLAVIARFRLGPRAGRAEVTTNVRLATTQNVHAIAEMSDSSLWEAQTEVVVLLAACLDGA
jgi:sulfur-oxidizing protein SoxY